MSGRSELLYTTFSLIFMVTTFVVFNLLAIRITVHHPKFSGLIRFLLTDQLNILSRLSFLHAFTNLPK